MLSTYKSIPNNLRRIYTNDINLFFLKCMWNLIELRKEFFNRFTWHRKNACDLYYKLKCYILFHQWGVYSSTKITSKSRSLIRDKLFIPSDNKNLYYVHNAFRFSEMGRNGKHFRNVLWPFFITNMMEISKQDM